MKAVVAAFNQEKALVGAFSVITKLRMELFEALVQCESMIVLVQKHPVHLLDVVGIVPPSSPPLVGDVRVPEIVIPWEPRTPTVLARLTTDL